MSSEAKPHAVYPKDMLDAAWVFPTYEQAFEFWKYHQHWDRPWLIATLGRVIDPAAEIVDVNE